MTNTLRISMLLLLWLGTAHEKVHAQVLSGEKREQYIQKALQLRKAEQYTAAIQQLDSILLYQPKDAGVLLFKGDLKLQSKLYGQAVQIYKVLLPLQYETTITRVNLSYALFMAHHPQQALQYAAAAWIHDSLNTNAVINHFNAMLWNLQTKKAAAFLQQQERLLSPAQKLVLKARLYTTAGDYPNGLRYYDSLAGAYPDKYYVLEYAEVLLGKKEMARSVETIKQHRQLFSASDYDGFRQKVSAALVQQAGTELIFFKDVAENMRIESSAWWQQRDGVRYRFRISAGLSELTSAQSEKTSVQFGHITVNERWNRAWSGQTDIHLQTIKPNTGETFTGVTGRQTIQYQPNDRRMIGLFYNSDILNYTASLLGRNIRSHNIGYVTHILVTGKTGIYSQGSLGDINDGNQQFQCFASLYHLFRTEPAFKTGLNFAVLHFKDSSIKTYFSPNRYLSAEVFTDYSTALPHLSKLYLQLQAAAGMQQIENQQWEPALRFQSEMGLRLAHFETALKYQTSNVASATGTGYSFNWLVFRLLWKW